MFKSDAAKRFNKFSPLVGEHHPPRPRTQDAQICLPTTEHKRGGDNPLTPERDHSEHPEELTAADVNNSAHEEGRTQKAAA